MADEFYSDDRSFDDAAWNPLMSTGDMRGIRDDDESNLNLNQIVHREVQFDHGREHKLAPEPPVVPGGYIEPSYHFRAASSDYQTLFQQVTDVVRKHGIDYLAQTNDFKLKCVTYYNGESVPFIVSIFRMDPQSSEYAVEFQKRDGSIVFFSELFRKMRRELAAAGCIKGKTARDFPEVPEVDHRSLQLDVQVCGFNFRVCFFPSRDPLLALAVGLVMV